MSDRYAKYNKLKFDYPAERVLRITFDRPETFNSVDAETHTQMTDMWLDIDRDPDINAVIVTGAGKAFSAGGDINDFKGTTDELHALMGRISHHWFKAFWNLPQPVINAVNGPAGGGGCTLALAGDLIYASDNAYFVNTFLEIGLVPDLGGLFTLPRLIGPARAKEMALLGERLPAHTAAQMGLINAVYAQDQLMAEVQKRAEHLAARSASAITQTKRIINRSFESSMEAVLDQELAAQSFLFGTDASKSGVDYFLKVRADSRKTKSAAKPKKGN